VLYLRLAAAAFLMRAAAFFRVLGTFKSNSRRVSSANHLRHDEIEVNVRGRDGLRNGMPQPRSVVTFYQKGRNSGGLESRCLRCGNQLFPRDRIKFHRSLCLVARVTISTTTMITGVVEGKPV